MNKEDFARRKILPYYEPPQIPHWKVDQEKDLIKRRERKPLNDAEEKGSDKEKIKRRKIWSLLFLYEINIIKKNVYGINLQRELHPKSYICIYIYLYLQG